MADQQKHVEPSPKRKAASNAERQRKYQKKMSADPEFRQRENERTESLRKKRFEENVEAARAKSRDTSRRYREKKKLEAMTSKQGRNKGGFKSPQALGKAIKRVYCALPSSPSKAAITLQGIAKNVGVELKSKMFDKLKGPNALSEETEALIKEFYFRMDVVYTTPGLNDYMTVWAAGERSRERKYYLTMYLKELFALFKKTYPDNEVKFSKFASLKPANVLLLKEQPRDQCKCKQHENFTLKLKALKVNYSGTEFWAASLCDNEELQNECWKNKCADCQNGRLFFNQYESDLSSNVVWKEWVKEDNKVRITMKEGCRGELLERLRDDWAVFKEHVRTKRIQSNAFEKDKQSSELSVLQFDYAMAFSCEYQNEIQSGLWSRASVNLFTAALYCKDAECQSFLLASESSDKGKCATYTNLMKLANIIKRKDLGKSLVLFSDGPSSEFKNKYVQKILIDLQELLQINIFWKYFATSHGKGVVDGIGGNAKACVRARIMSKGEGVVVQGARDFVKVAKESLKKVTVLEVTEDEIGKNMQIWDACEEVPGIKKVHSIELSDGKMKFYPNDLDRRVGSSLILERVIYEAQLSLRAGDWVEVIYDDKSYPGEVIKVAKDDVQVSVMTRHFAQHWKWPAIKDQIFYPAHAIVRKIAPPEPVGTGDRGQYRFLDMP